MAVPGDWLLLQTWCVCDWGSCDRLLCPLPSNTKAEYELRMSMSNGVAARIVLVL